jgi:hypothetical protein
MDKNRPKTFPQAFPQLQVRGKALSAREYSHEEMLKTPDLLVITRKLPGIQTRTARGPRKILAGRNKIALNRLNTPPTAIPTRRKGKVSSQTIG